MDYSNFWQYLCDSLVDGPGPDGELAEVGPGVVDDGLEHVVPERDADGLGGAPNLGGHEEGSIAGALKKN